MLFCLLFMSVIFLNVPEVPAKEDYEVLEGQELLESGDQLDDDKPAL